MVVGCGAWSIAVLREESDVGYVWSTCARRVLCGLRTVWASDGIGWTGWTGWAGRDKDMSGELYGVTCEDERGSHVCDEGRRWFGT